MENNRRNFIKKLSAFSASAALISAAPMVAAAKTPRAAAAKASESISKKSKQDSDSDFEQ